MYVMITQSLDKTLGIQALEEAIVKIEESIKASGGTLIVKMKPKAVSENDDLELQQLMEKMERENAEISGDEDEDDDEDKDGSDDDESEDDD
jgi:translation initiation factor 2 subunit 1